MEFFQPYVNMFRNYINFSGRTRRRDFWVAVLVNFVITLILSILTRFLSVFGVVQTIYGWAVCSRSSLSGQGGCTTSI